MSYYSDMSGLELFSDPFSRPQAYSRPSSNNKSATAPQSKTATTQPRPVAPRAQQSNTTSKPVAQAESPTTQEKGKTPAQSQKPKETPAPAKSSAPVKPQKSETPKKALELDMSSSGTATADDTIQRKAHEEAEAKRKAEWEAKQIAKKQTEEEAIQKLQSMSDDDVIAASVERVSTDVERITRRNMKECVSAHIQELARKDASFARHTMHPRKSMINCFKYINRMAKDYVRQEMEDNDTQPDNGMYGGDVPDGIVYQWAVDYFNDPDAQEDRVKEEKFTPRPYVAKSPSKPSSKATKTSKKTSAKEPKKEPEQKDDYQQMSLF